MRWEFALMMKLMRVVFLAGTIVLAACGSDGGDPVESPAESPVPTVRPGQHGPIASGTFSFEGTLDLTGEYTVLYAFNDPNAETCAKIADADGAGYVVPLPTFHGDRRFVWTASIRQFAGPGTYDRGDLGSVSVQVRKTADAEPVAYTAPKNATVDLEVDDENAGSFTFKGFETEKGDELSGRARWTCREGSEGEEER